MSKLNDFQWRAEELDKLKVSEYKYVNIQIDNDYQWGSGWTSEQERRFTNEVYPKLREAGYSINAPTMSGACSTLSVRGDRHTDIYMHPMNFTGYAKVEDIEKLEALLSGCECIDNVNIIRKDDCYDLSDHNYRKLIAAHAKEIMACLDEKTSKYDVGLDFAEKHRIPRVGDKMGLSSFDVDVSAVEMVFETAKNLGYFEERSRQATQNTSQINNVDASVAVPLYKEDITTAKNNGEVELYKQSLNYNKACAKDIDKAIHSYYADNNFDARAALKELSDKYDAERITHIVAAHIANHDYDGRYHKDVVDWAKNKMSEFTPLFIDKSNDYRLTAHAVLIDGFAQKCIENEMSKVAEIEAEIQAFAKKIEEAAFVTPYYFQIQSELKTTSSNIDYIMSGNNKDEAIKKFAYTLISNAKIHDCYHTLKHIVTKQLMQTVNKESDEQQEQPRETPHNKNDEFTLYEHEDTLALFKNRILISDADKHTNSADELYAMIPNNATVWTVHDDGSGSLKMDNQTVARYDLATREINMGDGWEVANCSRFEDVREYVYTKLNLSEYGEPRLANEATREKQEADSTKHEQWENYGDENFIETSLKMADCFFVTHTAKLKERQTLLSKISWKSLSLP